MIKKTSLKENLEKYFEDIAWENYPNLLKIANENKWNCGEGVTERGLKIVLSKLQNNGKLFASSSKWAWSKSQSEVSRTTPRSFVWSQIEKNEKRARDFAPVFNWIDDPESPDNIQNLASFLKKECANVVELLTSSSEKQ